MNKLKQKTCLILLAEPLAEQIKRLVNFYPVFVAGCLLCKVASYMIRHLKFIGSDRVAFVWCLVSIVATEWRYGPSIEVIHEN
jgi:hypothetical protein